MVLFVSTGLICCAEEESDVQRASIPAESLPNDTASTVSASSDEVPAGGSSQSVTANMGPVGNDSATQRPPETPMAGIMDSDLILRPGAGHSSPSVETASCDVALSGAPWVNTTVESTPNFEAELAAVNLDDVPEEFDLSGLNPLMLSMVAYALDIPINSIGESMSSAVLLEGNPLQRSVAASLVLGQDDPLGIDFGFLRRGLQRYYHCDREFPLTLDGFKRRIFDYGPIEPTDIYSISKCGVRNLMVDESAGAYVAESVVDGTVRETEILLTGRRNDGNLDFLVYDAAGQLRDRTQFPTISMGPHVTAASPYVCTTCHTNQDPETGNFRYRLLFPNVGPCARR